MNEYCRPTLRLLVTGSVVCMTTAVLPADKLHRLAASQIRAKFPGMEMTDNVHFADVFGPNGSLRSYSMGRRADAKWWIEKDELCFDRGKESGGCYQVWMAGPKVELKREGLDAPLVEGVLQRQTNRN